MHRRLAIIASAALLAPGVVGTAALVANASNRSSADTDRDRPGGRQFVGYWMGIDPLDGGDSRRGITRNDDGTFSMIGRDTVFTLCDDTDRAIITGDAVVADDSLVSDNTVITCTNDQSKVELKVRYDVVARNILRETVTTPAGEPVDEIIFHLVSER